MMRSLELALLSANAAALLTFVIPALRKLRWGFMVLLLAVVVAAAQVLLEGYRWQMVPAYALTICLLLVWSLHSIRPTKIHPNKRRRLAAGIAITAGVLLWIIGVALPLLFPVFSLPKPDGPYQIGTVTYHWTENGREIFDSKITNRQLMVQVWYPVTNSNSSARASYLPDAGAVSTTLGHSSHLPGFLLSHLDYVKTNAIPSARIARGDTTYPVLVFLTGVVGYRQSNTIQIEHLVSHGYIVVGIDQPYAAAAVTFPDGQVISGWTRDQIQPLINQSLTPAKSTPSVNGHPLKDGVVPYLSSDVTFILDQLADINQNDPQGILTRRLDLQHIGAFGVSLGAMVVGEACHADQRIKACLMMDSAMPADVVASGLSQPAMWLTRPVSDMQREKWAPSDISLTTDSMRAVYNKEPLGNGYYVQIPGMFHVNFTDGPLFSPLASRLGFTGPIGTKGFSVVNDYSLAFFDHYLYERNAPLLHGPTNRYPTVLFEKR